MMTGTQVSRLSTSILLYDSNYLDHVFVTDFLTSLEGISWIYCLYDDMYCAWLLIYLLFTVGFRYYSGDTQSKFTASFIKNDMKLILTHFPHCNYAFNQQNLWLIVYNSFCFFFNLPIKGGDIVP